MIFLGCKPISPGVGRMAPSVFISSKDLCPRKSGTLHRKPLKTTGSSLNLRMAHLVIFADGDSHIGFVYKHHQNSITPGFSINCRRFWAHDLIFPQRKLRGSAQNSSGVHWCRCRVKFNEGLWCRARSGSTGFAVI